MAERPAPEKASASGAVAAVWERFRGTMDERVSAVERAARLLAGGGLDAETRRGAEREAHKLAGALGTFGFPEGTRLARAAEEILVGERPLSAPEGARLEEIVRALRAELERPPGEPSGARPAPSPTAAPAAPPEVTGEPERRLPLVLVVEPDRDYGLRLQEAAKARGMRPLRVSSAEEAEGLLEDHRPDAALMDLAPGEEGLSLLGRLSSLRPPVPVVVLTGRDSFLDRVEVARRGARTFLSRPVAPEAALDALQAALQETVAAESTVLAVDDDPVLLESMARLLRPRGVRVEPLPDPHRFWEVLDATDPDVVVLDVDMPGIDGLEICRTLRTDPRWRAVPVLFLTGRTDAATVASVFAAGADDYVPKPILGPELVNRIANRLERTQLLRNLADTDPLTGLANRRRATEQMQQLLRLATRQEAPYCVAVVDLDHFKAVNDRWGHPAGDEVLKRAANLLSRHFRVEDVVARWGGEEFVAGLFGIEKEDAVQRLAALLERLREQRFGPPDRPFGVTASAGVAQFPADGSTPEALYRAADQALYQAKQAGRNRVLAADRAPAAPAQGDRVDVLMVLQDPVAARLLREGLEDRGLSARRVTEAREASALLAERRTPFHARVVLLDLDLPGVDGHALLRRLAAAPTQERARVIVLSARAQEAEVVAALDAGAFDHVGKPFSVALLLHRTLRALHA